MINNFRDVQRLLLQFGTVVYTKDKALDLEMIEEELKELREHGFIEAEDYMKAFMILKKRRREL